MKGGNEAQEDQSVVNFSVGFCLLSAQKVKEEKERETEREEHVFGDKRQQRIR